MFDGSSIRGFTSIEKSDMKLIADVSDAYVDPFRACPTLVVNCSIVDPFTDAPFPRDPRQVAAKAEAYLRSTGIADTCFIGAEAEFYLFDSVRYQTRPYDTFVKLDSVEGYWNTGREEEGGNLAYKTPLKGGYFPVSPSDKFCDLRDYMVKLLSESGLTMERAHHEVGSGGQHEINYRFNSLMAAGDDMMKFKYVIKNSALEFGTPRKKRELPPPLCLNPWRAITVRECTPIFRSGKRVNRCFMTKPVMVPSLTWLVTLLGACCSTHQRC